MEPGSETGYDIVTVSDNNLIPLAIKSSVDFNNNCLIYKENYTGATENFLHLE